MPDTIERTIYKLEIDGEGYIRGVDSLSASTKKFSEEQERANQTLKTNETALKTNTDRLNKAKADLEAYAGTNARYRKQLENDVKSAEKDQAQLTQLVNNNRVAYEKATKAAQDFANTSARATQLQQQTGGKIPVPSVVGPVIPQLGGGLKDALSNISLGDLPDTLRAVIPEFEQLRTAIAEAKARMAELNEEDEEFKELAPIVAQGEEALRLYDQAVKSTDSSHKSLRSQLREGREELVRLEQQGKANTKEYIELEKSVAKLTDEFADQQQRIRILSSDTKLLDFGKGAITAATSAFQVYASVQILVGDQSEELQKLTMDLFAAMQLLQAMEQLSNLTRREGVVATLAQSAAQSIYTAAVGATTGALKVFRLALLGTGIGAAIAGITFLVLKLKEMREAQDEVAERQQFLIDVNNKAIDIYASEVIKLDQIRNKLKDLSTPQNERIKLAKEYNKTADEGNKLDLKQIDNIDLLNSAIDRQIEKIKQRALAQAANNVLTEKGTEFLKQQNKIITEFPALNVDDATIDRIVQQFKEGTLDLSQFTAQQQEQFQRALLSGDIQKFLNLRSEFNQLSKRVSELTTDETKGGGGTTRQIDNVFAQERQKQRERLAELLRQSVEDEKTIRAEFEQQLITEKQRIDELLKDKKLTKPQAQTLKIEASKINTVELDKALADFRKKVTDARDKINDELRDLQDKAIQDSINLLQDEFERRKQLIDFNERQEIEDAKENTQERIESLELDRLLIGEENYQRARAGIVSAGEQEILNITGQFARERQDLTADIFKRSLDVADQILEEQLTQLDENTAAKIREQKALLQAGTINYDQFQKALTKIQKDQKAERDKARLQELRTELEAINARLRATQNAEEREELQKRQRSVRGQIAEIESQVPEDPNKERKESIVQYAEAIGQLTDAIVSFWVKANEAEQKALDRSIELQERRVEAAQKIAERGNAEYLQQEEDRLKQLEIARENAARRQLAIDAALQSSQLLVAITGAISKIATPGIGIAETIGAIAVIVGALSTGYGLVRSLQGNQPRLAEGTTYVQRGKNPKGKDTIPAWLNEGEAVMPAETNRNYKPTVEAIYHGKVPANVINKFVDHYVKGKIARAPEPNYQRIKETAEMHISHDSRVASMINDQNRLIMENNDLQRQTLRAMKNMSVSATIDRQGIAIAVNEYVQQMLIDKRI